jgi:hypothetical protein
MWVIGEELARATMRTREREAEQGRLVSEARRQARQDGATRGWSWRVEPGMDGAFRNLLGWLLSSQRDAPVETAAPPAQGQATWTKSEQMPSTASSEGPGWYCCSPACCPPGCCA